MKIGRGSDWLGDSVINQNRQVGLVCSRDKKKIAVELYDFALHVDEETVYKPALGVEENVRVSFSAVGAE